MAGTWRKIELGEYPELQLEIMFDDFHKILEEIRQIPEPEKVAAAQTAFVTWCIAKVVYYVVAGLVTWALGRRIIQGLFAAWREARRSTVSGQ